MVVSNRIVVAFGGPYKRKAIEAALRGGIFNVWFTDEHTAREIAAAQ